jgi:hypothetical protein
MDSEPKNNKFETIQESIANSPDRIEAEFNRSANNWISCVGTRVVLIEMQLNHPETKSLISDELYQKATARLEQLKVRIHELQKIYPDKSTNPPEEVKQELINGLDVLKE